MVLSKAGMKMLRIFYKDRSSHVKKVSDKTVQQLAKAGFITWLGRGNPPTEGTAPYRICARGVTFIREN